MVGNEGKRRDRKAAATGVVGQLRVWKMDNSHYGDHKKWLTQSATIALSTAIHQPPCLVDEYDLPSKHLVVHETCTAYCAKP